MASFRWPQPGGLALVLCLTGCAHAGPALGPPTTRDRFTQYLMGRFGTGVPAPCPGQRLRLGATDLAQTEHLYLRLHLPRGFENGPRRLVPAHAVDAAGPFDGETWLPGLTIESVFWNRWTRAEGGAGADVDAPTTLVQLTARRGYQRFSPSPEWEFAEAAECALTFDGRTARVFRFRLVRRGMAPVWGVEAFWQGRPADGWIAFFGLAPSESAQAELLAIIAAIDA